MIWLIPFLLVCLFLLFRFVSPFQESGLFDSLATPPSPPGRGKSTEGFQALLVSPSFQKAYGEFLAFHQEFQTRWREALDTAHSMSQEPGKASTKERTDEQRNMTAQELSATQGKPLPLLVSLPSTVATLEDIERAQLLVRIPPSAQPYQDALEWMNQSLLRAQKEVQNALKGGGIGQGGQGVEGFDSSTAGQCAEIAQCFKDNPELVRQVVVAQQEDAKARLERIQRELMERFQQFQQPRLRSAFELNGRLRAEAKEVQRKAQSGEWVKDVKIGQGQGQEPRPKPILPPGAGALEELRRSNPERYAEVSSSPLFSVKQLIDQINRSL